jgi:hypothetical protein
MKKATRFEELSCEELTWSLDPGKIDFETSDGCDPCEEIIGQDRALKAIKTGLDIRSLGNIIFKIVKSGSCIWLRANDCPNKQHN